jgi:phenol 2-monooxygenase
VFVDDVDLTGTMGGKVYDSFGIGPDGAIALIRPDGYVGLVAPFEEVDTLNGYFRATGMMA